MLLTDCKHKIVDTRILRQCNQVKLQCLDCGQAVGNPIAHNKLKPETLVGIVDFDEDLRESGRKKMADERHSDFLDRQAQIGRKIQVMRMDHAEYLSTPEWKMKRQMVIEREGNLCQGCRKSQIHDIHHASYETHGDELLFQLVGLCRPCHERIHNLRTK